ncbi:MAG: hypothetical protein MSA15_13265 [Clostridium sp.]|nr:hypothetical protein [Clostridium sp.]
MKKMLVLLVMLLMVGCEAKDTEKPKQIIEKAVKQEQQIEEPKEEVKEQPKKVETKEEPKQVEKELPKKEEPKKKEQDDNIDPETGLAKVKDGTHLEEEAKKQEEEGIIEPEEEYNEEDDEDWIREYGNTDEVDDYSEENGYN